MNIYTLLLSSGKTNRGNNSPIGICDVQNLFPISALHRLRGILVTGRPCDHIRTPARILGLGTIHRMDECVACLWAPEPIPDDRSHVRMVDLELEARG